MTIVFRVYCDRKLLLDTHSMASSADSHDLTELTPVKLVDDDGEETDVKVP